MAHTPGPWTWAIHDHSAATLHGPDVMRDHVVSVSPCGACCDGANPKEWEWGRCTTPKIDDARLISAAPDLLAMLRACVGLIEAAHAAEQEDWRPGFDDVELTSDGSVRLSDARAAIAKAVAQ